MQQEQEEDQVLISNEEKERKLMKRVKFFFVDHLRRTGVYKKSVRTLTDAVARNKEIQRLFDALSPEEQEAFKLKAQNESRESYGPGSFVYFLFPLPPADENPCRCLVDLRPHFDPVQYFKQFILTRFKQKDDHVVTPCGDLVMISSSANEANQLKNKLATQYASKYQSDVVIYGNAVLVLKREKEHEKTKTVTVSYVSLTKEDCYDLYIWCQQDGNIKTNSRFVHRKVPKLKQAIDFFEEDRKKNGTRPKCENIELYTKEKQEAFSKLTAQERSKYEDLARQDKERYTKAKEELDKTLPKKPVTKTSRRLYEQENSANPNVTRWLDLDQKEKQVWIDKARTYNRTQYMVDYNKYSDECKELGIVPEPASMLYASDSTDQVVVKRARSKSNKPNKDKEQDHEKSKASPKKAKQPRVKSTNVSETDKVKKPRKSKVKSQTKDQTVESSDVTMTEPDLPALPALDSSSDAVSSSVSVSA